MENLFLNAINAISESRFWLGPLLLVCVYVMLMNVIVEGFLAAQREIDG